MPSPNEDNWLDLGFCTAQTPSHHYNTGRLYNVLTNHCTFEGFWRAMEKSTMVELFSRHGLDSEIEKLRNFRTFMLSVGRWHQKVWELKRFTRLTDREPMRAVVMDYGFKNRHNARERLQLRTLYADFFAMGLDEMDLHQACVEGRLALFLESVLGQVPFPREFLLNLYPLDRCTRMGLVAERTILCSESDYPLVCQMLRAKGDQSVVWTVPDDCDDMKTIVRERAAYLTGSMRVWRETFQGQAVEILSSL